MCGAFGDEDRRILIGLSRESQTAREQTSSAIAPADALSGQPGPTHNAPIR